jgi:hypothetical protein
LRRTTARYRLDWGGYGELFDFDADTRALVLSEVATYLTRDLLE